MIPRMNLMTANYGFDHLLLNEIVTRAQPQQNERLCTHYSRAWGESAQRPFCKYLKVPITIHTESIAIKLEYITITY